MKRNPLSLSLVLMMLACATGSPEVMSRESLARYIDEFAGSAETSQNVVEFQYEGVAIPAVSDATHDRMRLIAPIARLDDLEADLLEVLLVANFHTTLDGRYAVSEGVLYAAFLHPLSTLTRAQLEPAIRQVAALSRNFGSSYSSDELVYGAETGKET